MPKPSASPLWLPKPKGGARVGPASYPSSSRSNQTSGLDLSTLSFHDKEMVRKDKGRSSSNIRPPKGVNDIKGMRRRNTGPTKGVKDIKGMRSRDAGSGREGLGQTQKILKRNLEQVRKNVSSARDNVQSGLSQTRSRLQTSVGAAQDTLGKSTQRAGENLKKARENVEYIPEAIQEMLIRRALQIGVRTATRRVSKRLKRWDFSQPLSRRNLSGKC